MKRRGGEYQGHHCWACWNVSLWVLNDESLYRTAVAYGTAQSSRQAAREMIRDFSLTTTPDGARYTVKSLSKAIAATKK